MTVGERIRAARKAKGLTQKQLGEACGIAEPTIRRYELGKLNPKFSTLKKIGKALHVTASYLQGYETEEATRLLEALKAKDYDTVENLLGIPNGSFIPLNDEEVASIEREQLETRKNLFIVRTHFSAYSPYFFSDKMRECWDIIIPTVFSLNLDGQQAVVKAICDLAKIPEYQKDFSQPSESGQTQEPPPQPTEEVPTEDTEKKDSEEG